MHYEYIITGFAVLPLMITTIIGIVKFRSPLMKTLSITACIVFIVIFIGSLVGASEKTATIAANTATEILIVCVFVSVFGGIVGLIVAIIDDSQKKRIVLEHSQRVQRLLELNKSIHFYPVRSTYHFHHECQSKRQLEHFQMDDYLSVLIESDEHFFRNLLSNIQHNILSYNQYIHQVQAIKTTATETASQTLGLTLSQFLKYEERVFKKNILSSPQVDTIIYCKATYVSPKGRNHYRKDKQYNDCELKIAFNRTMLQKQQRQSRQNQIRIERAKMTDSLRYDILKRDNFRCQICGSCASDGVKLHVDHIKPVSKGGLTTPDNLRTLCDRCNMGKSDKM